MESEDPTTLSEAEKLALAHLSNQISLNCKIFDWAHDSVHIFDGCVRKIAIRYADIGEHLRELYSFSMLEELALIDVGLNLFPDLSKWPLLRKLSLASNRIKFISPPSVKIPHLNLQDLNLARNGISVVENLDYYPMLRSLNLSLNRITAIDNLSSLRNLQILNLADNKIPTIHNLDSNIALEQLYLGLNPAINQIQGLSALTALKILDLNGNSIEQISNLQGLYQLTELRLDENPLQEDFTRYSQRSPQYWVHFCDSEIRALKFPFFIFGFIGYSKSGKTCSIEALVSYLKGKNKRVIVAKHIHKPDFSIDTPGKNSWRFSRAGADRVLTFSPQETSVIINQQLSPVKTLEYIKALIPLDDNFRSFGDYVVILEGYRDLAIPYILCASNEEDVHKQLSPDVNAISGVITSPDNSRWHGQSIEGRPLVNIMASPGDLFEIEPFRNLFHS